MKTQADTIPYIHLNLYDLMQQKNMTVLELSRRTGLSRTNIYFMLNRPPSGIQFDTLARICKALEVDPSTLLELQEKKK